tara:strand:+ start:537 stop:638 length:102 start_codon:yes stop_codon:yes gene_type:complete
MKTDKEQEFKEMNCSKTLSDGGVDLNSVLKGEK